MASFRRVQSTEALSGCRSRICNTVGTHSAKNVARCFASSPIRRCGFEASGIHLFYAQHRRDEWEIPTRAIRNIGVSGRYTSLA